MEQNSVAIQIWQMKADFLSKHVVWWDLSVNLGAELGEYNALT